MNTREVAEFLGVSTRRVRQLIEARRLKAVLINPRVYWVTEPKIKLKKLKKELASYFLRG